MKFLLDENVPKKLSQIIKKLKHDCITLHDLGTLGISNGELANYALEHKLVIITCDSDFLILKKALQAKSRIIYFDVHPRLTNKLIELLERNIDYCVKKLIEPGIMVITENECKIKQVE